MPSDKARDDLPDYQESAFGRMLAKALMMRAGLRRKAYENTPRRPFRARVDRADRDRPTNAAGGASSTGPTENPDTPRSLPEPHRIPQRRWPLHDEQY